MYRAQVSEPEKFDYLDIVHLGKCEKILPLIPSGVADAYVSDPPYGIGKREPTLDEIIAYLTGGASLDTGGDFMNNDWELPSVAVWKEVFRILKPGAYVLAFASTRTFDLMSMGLRAAGFENRDTFANEFGAPVLQWIQSQGMPKSHNVSKAMAKSKKKPKKKETSPPPSEEEIAQWEGYGTGLKPCWEPILVFRKPLEEKTISAQVRKTGTGTMNISACRIKHSSPEDFEKHKAGVDAIKARGGSMEGSWKNSSDLSGANEVTNAGRWPANVLLTHSEECIRVGTKIVKAHPQGPDRFQKTNGGMFSTEYGNQETPNEDEVHDAWQCAEGCPIATLDAQSGDRPATLTGRADPNVRHENPATARPDAFFGHLKGGIGPVYADSGGASKYFAQFEVEAPFIYKAKTSRRDKNRGLPEGVDNKHPTVKPVALMRYLVRLVTPKGGIVLDSFCGSGSTLVAAVDEGVHFIGIEMNEEHIQTARARVNGVEEEAVEKNSARDLAALVDALPQE